eukprot:gene16252-12808_t
MIVIVGLRMRFATLFPGLTLLLRYIKPATKSKPHCGSDQFDNLSKVSPMMKPKSFNQFSNCITIITFVAFSIVNRWQTLGFQFIWSYLTLLLRDVLAEQHALHALNGNGAVGEESYEKLGLAYAEPAGRNLKPKPKPRDREEDRGRGRARDRDPPRSDPPHRRGEERGREPPRFSKPPHRRGEERRGGSPPPPPHRRGGGGDDSDGSYEFDPTTSPYLTESGRRWHKAQRRELSPPRGSLAVSREFD